jgi:hypothetical protein
MSDEQRTRIIGYARTISSTIPAEPEGEGDENPLLTFVVDEVADRILLYLNDTVLDEKLERVAAKVVVAVFNQTNNNKDATGPEQAISSMSDNGQSISYRNEVKNYLATADDGALFGGFSALLARYRKVDTYADSE